MRRFDAVLFDFTGVLTSSPFTNLAALEARRGHPPGAVVRLVMGDYSVDSDHPWHRLERGEMPAQQYFTEVVALAESSALTVDFTEVFAALSGLAVHDNVVRYVHDLRAEGYQTALVTNNVREFGRSWRTMVDLDALFDAVIDSSEIGVRKPDPAIFAAALAALGEVDAERAVFLDDVAANVAAARAAGLAGIVVDDPAAALAELDLLLGRAAHGAT